MQDVSCVNVDVAVEQYFCGDFSGSGLGSL